ncbi:MAG TPA: cytochrome c [Blastocatellia bacterium]|nr:cytochrome c [Blastocatellia bacterium]
MKRREWSLYGLGLCVLILVAFRSGSAHVPITTKVRFTREVIRIFQQNCLGCHRPGGIAPFSLASYEEARPWAKAIKEELLEKRMPPWNALKGFGDFRNAPPLMQNDVDLVVNWVEGGVPRGDAKDLPPEPLISSDWPLGVPDRVVELPVVEVAADADEFRCLPVPLSLGRDVWVSAFDLDPGNGTVVHCATFYRERREEEPKSYADGREIASPGQSCPPPGEILGTWVPGLTPAHLSPGIGYRISPETRLVARVHYRGRGEATVVHSRIGLYFSRSGRNRPITLISFTSPSERIPPGESRHALRLQHIVESDLAAVAVLPLAHPLLVSLQVTAYRPDNTATVLLWTRGSRFDWRPTYIYKEPVPLPRGTRLVVTAYFNNSSENPFMENESPKPVRLSEITPDSLCTLLVVPEK